jgi:hypothetical protein
LEAIALAVEIGCVALLDCARSKAQCLQNRASSLFSFPQFEQVIVLALPVGALQEGQNFASGSTVAEQFEHILVIFSASI